MQEDNVAIRLKSLINDLGINSALFADTCGISRATLSQLLTGRNKKVNDILISQIHKAYPNLSILWLLFNEGEMWVNTESRSSETNDTDAIESSNHDANSIEILEKGSDASTAAISSSSSSSSQMTKYPYENQNFPNSGHSGNNFSKDTPLNSSATGHHSSEKQSINSQIDNAILLSEIENLRTKIRKVVQITIYYDDSTFETFYPK